MVNSSAASIFRPWLLILPFGALVGLFQWSARWLGDMIALPWLSENGVPLIVFLLLLVPIVFALKKPINRASKSRLSWFKPDFMKRGTGQDIGALSFTAQFVLAFGLPAGIALVLSSELRNDPRAALITIGALTALSIPIGFMFWEERKRTEV